MILFVNCTVLYCIYAFRLVQHHVNDDVVQDDEVHHKGLKVIRVPFECIHATHCSVRIVPNASV